MTAPQSSPPEDSVDRVPGVANLTRTECVSLLRTASVGRIGFVVDGWPVVLPMNYCFDGDDVVIRTDPRAKLAAASRHGAPVALQVDSPVMLYKAGWSVLAHGVADEITDSDELTRMSSLPLVPWAMGSRGQWIRIRLVQITGRRLAERGRYPDRPA
jgi:uncharacterized protein